MAAVPSIGRASAVEPRPIPAAEAQATGLLYERYSRQIFNFCLHRLGSREEAEDAAQTTFLNAFRGMQRGVRPEVEQAWLFKIAENVCLTRHRSTFRRRRVESPSDLDVLQEVVPSPQRDAETLIRLSDALSEMSDQQRKALLLREWQGLSYREIAEELGLSQPAVETLLFRARRSLASGLTEAPGKKRRARLRSGLDIGAVLAAAKAAFAGGAAVKVAAVAAVATTTAVAGNEVKRVEHAHAQKPHGAVRVAKASAPPARLLTSAAPVARIVSSAAKAKRVAPQSAPARRPSPLATRRATALRVARLGEEQVAAAPVVVGAPEPAPAPAAPAAAVEVAPSPAAQPAEEHPAPAPSTTAAPAPQAEATKAPDPRKREHRHDWKADRGVRAASTLPAMPSLPTAQDGTDSDADDAAQTGDVDAAAQPETQSPESPPPGQPAAPQQTSTSAPIAKVNDGGKRDRWKNRLPELPLPVTPAAAPPTPAPGESAAGAAAPSSDGKDRDRANGRRR